MGDIAYNLLLRANSYITAARNILNLKPWSLSKYAKAKVKGAVDFIFKFEETAIRAVQDKYDGIICGHIHHPEIKLFGDTLYLNSGDWVETCSWIGETHDGKFQIWEWNQGDPIMLKEYDNKNILEK